MAAPASTYSFEPFIDALGKDFFEDDPDLSVLLSYHGLEPGESWDKVSRYGKFSASAGAAGAEATDRPDSLPQLLPFDAYGEPHPVGVSVPQATRRVLAAALRAGVATEPDVRVRYAMAYLGAQVGEAGVMCPLACTDGLVRTLQELDGGVRAQAALEHILLQAPHGPVHGAQFVTEVQGGSDAGTNRVRAVPQEDGSYRLYGPKWFCSNAWAQYWAVTARPEDAPDGPRGVGLFLVPREEPLGTANGFRLDRLKDKLGTRSLPTAEMTLDGAKAWPLGDLRSGLSNVVRIVLTTSRFWCALAATAQIRAAERIAHAYAHFRNAFGQPIASFPLVAETLEQLTRDRRHLLAGCFEVLAIWERVAAAERSGEAPDPQDALRARLLVMMAKTVCTRRGTQRVHDAMMVLGGNGIEERFSALPRLLRDAVILETWEGPHGLLTSRLLLDMGKHGGAEDPAGLAGLILGGQADDAEKEAVGEALAHALGQGDARVQALAFSDWLHQCFDVFGASCWRAASGD
ncbi:MAG TPA: hypothetical protein DIU15_13315 [Deltaproteobacteria bacterium]|nr:hypothetical protein [Deltaproteobacteria bacterium]HCP47019.1 hypothetical protein [Deltaproteobacteria bacterium]